VLRKKDGIKNMITDNELVSLIPSVESRHPSYSNMARDSMDQEIQTGDQDPRKTDERIFGISHQQKIILDS
jgi:hypothetical protein